MPLLLCPNDNAAMQQIDRNGVLIDVCPQCRGVWLDRGELEKLLGLVEQGRPAREAAPESRSREREYRSDDREGKRRKRFDLFDFFD